MYKTVRPELRLYFAKSEYRRVREHRVFGISIEILQALIEFVPENEQNWLKNCCLVTVSQRIADVAVQQGWHNVVVSAGADNQSLLNTLLNEVTPLSH